MSEHQDGLAWTLPPKDNSQYRGRRGADDGLFQLAAGGRRGR